MVEYNQMTDEWHRAAQSTTAINYTLFEDTNCQFVFRTLNFEN